MLKRIIVICVVSMVVFGCANKLSVGVVGKAVNNQAAVLANI